MLTAREIKTQSSEIQTQFALNIYEKFKRDCYAIENEYSETKTLDLSDQLQFIRIGVDINSTEPFCNLSTSILTRTPTAPLCSGCTNDKAAITASKNFTYTFKEDVVLDKIQIVPDADVTVNIGITPNGTDIANAWVVTTTTSQLLTVGQSFPKGGVLYFTGITANCTVTLYFI